MADKNVIVKNYRAFFSLPAPKPMTCTLVGDDPDVLKERTRNVLRSILNGNPKFEPAAQSAAGRAGTVLIFHPELGEEACGWISEYEVPKHLSVQAPELRQEAA